MADIQIVAPDLTGNPWKVPMGFPIILANGKAYFFACAAPKGRASALLSLLDETQNIAETLGDVVKVEGQADSRVGFLQFFTSMEKLAATSLALQYSDATIGEIDECGALDAKALKIIMSAIAGQAPPDEVTVPKK